MKFETAVLDVIPRTSDTVSYRFPRPEGFDYRPGQYMMVTIIADKIELTHPFSISSSPTDKDFLEFTKKLTQSNYSARLRQMQTGDWSRIDGPYGKFTCECEYEKILFLAGGIGITPFYSVIKYCTDKQLPTDLILMHGVKNEGDTPFKKELEGMRERNSKLRLEYVVFEPSPTWTGKTGIITSEMIRAVVSDYKERIFYICGPPGMVTAMQKIFSDLGMPPEKLRQESFAGHT